MADVVVHSTEPALGAIKLAWWRERLADLDQGRTEAEPRLQAAANELLPRGISGADLAALEGGWACLLEQKADAEIALARGSLLFSLAARLLGEKPPPFLAVLGRLYAAGSLQRRGLAPAGAFAITAGPRIASRFRPLSGLAALAKRDLGRREAEATPGRAWTLLRHRLTGKV